jgi:serine/threonine protein kinase
VRDTAQAVSRFRREVQALARMDPHPNIVMAMHASEHDGRMYLVMEYVPGTDLRRYVQETGPLPVAQSCEFIQQAAVALAYAHRHGIVHRDIKPANLLLTAASTIKLLDLGLARLAAADPAAADTGATKSGALLGTVDYLAPEQARDASHADARSDLYSLGCTFYFLLTGRAPFANRSTVEKLMAHAEQVPEPIHRVRPDVPPAIAAVVAKLMAKRPEDRYPSAVQFLDALGVVVQEMVSADGQSSSPGTADPELRFIGDLIRTVLTGRPMAGFAALVVVAVGVGMVWHAWPHAPGTSNAN